MKTLTLGLFFLHCTICVIGNYFKETERLCSSDGQITMECVVSPPGGTIRIQKGMGLVILNCQLQSAFSHFEMNSCNGTLVSISIGNFSEGDNGAYTCILNGFSEDIVLNYAAFPSPPEFLRNENAKAETCITCGTNSTDIYYTFDAPEDESLFDIKRTTGDSCTLSGWSDTYEQMSSISLKHDSCDLPSLNVIKCHATLPPEESTCAQALTATKSIPFESCDGADGIGCGCTCIASIVIMTLSALVASA